MSDRNRPGKGSFEELIDALASGKATWDRLEQELAAAGRFEPNSEKEDILTDAQCRRLEQLNRDPGKDEKKLQAELSKIPPLTKGARRFIDKMFRDDLVEGAILQGLRARGRMGSVADARDTGALYSTCDPRDGAELALARLIPMLLHATTSCFERAENWSHTEARNFELTNAFKGARVLAQLADSLHKDRPERSRKTEVSWEGRKHKRNHRADAGEVLVVAHGPARVLPCRSPAVAGKKRGAACMAE